MYELRGNRLEEIASLAESIAKENFTKGKTDLFRILKQSKIELIEGNYEDYFIGNLLHESSKFYLYLNMDSLIHAQQSRIRFTIAHELGHYFIDDHRNRLKEGDSLSFVSSSQSSSIEKEANHFASFLLMPRKHFLKKAANLDFGLSAILKLSGDFEASIEATAIHYAKINTAPVLIVRWGENNEVKYAFYSKKFVQRLKLPSKPAILKPTDYINNLNLQASASGGLQILEKATLVSTWVSNVQKNSIADAVALEESVKLGNYGGLTVLTC